LRKLRFFFLEGGGAEAGSLTAAVGSSDSAVDSEAELIIGCAQAVAGRASQGNEGPEDAV